MKQKPVYLNWNGPSGKETVDEFTRGEDAPEDRKEFRKYVRKLKPARAAIAQAEGGAQG